MNIEKIEKLAECYKYDNDVLLMLNNSLMSFGKYVEIVNELELCVKVLQYKLEPEELRTVRTNLDKNRTVAHNAVIAGIKFINRLCENNALEPFYYGDISIRRDMGSFAIEVAKELFDNRM